jgi:hypothetical protein
MTNTMQTKPVVPVMLRVWLDDSTSFAMFPTFPGTNQPFTCMTYQHIGQHSSAGIATAIAYSRPAKPEEHRALLNELTQIYDDCELKIVKRESPKMRAERHRALDRAS